MNPIDQSFLDFIWRKKLPSLSEERRRALETGVLTFSDLQVVTSFSILICGFSQLGCSLSAYHWQIMVYTAWFASVTHLTTLTAMRHYFDKANPKARFVRVLLMFCTICLLTVALIPTGNSEWLTDFKAINDVAVIHKYDYRGVPAVCYFTSMAKTSYYTLSPPTVAFAISVIVLWAGFFARFFRLYSSLSLVAMEWLRGWPARQIKNPIRWSLRTHASLPASIIHDVFAVQLIILRAVFNLYGSMFWEVSQTNI